ncbi:Any1p KNAG_0D04660 [Huiozyma naganishii CBS 8797]|uniref:PQ-loop repeat-containing protein 1 n=1 Tax=Huiozyma naganishii (strain ATCC MYA-139 / BCRC 22969 / CBS 8797 / KCTC 17520 / NBRC 10181 / NCYC 3082 / Yp74L-3) TaxID=1071383 RepID=J7S7A4_HUIN7|nr:hypothetical protein KNAG_0D04660 [Kazachstania naganishii CBS 8797]CCK70206.1 hypothetical protein KNAG_0D04660 [Kazachstania naganishii CBS 8797]
MELAEHVVSEPPAVGDTLSAYLPRIDQFYLPEWLTMQFVANNMISFTPLFSYGSTVISIEQSQTALGFSIDICATMLIASILRISYYLITPYEIALLRQSVVMVLIQVVLLKTSLKYRPMEYKYDYLKDVESLQKLLFEVWEEHYGTVQWKSLKSEDWALLINIKRFAACLYKFLLVFFYKFLKFFDPSYKRVMSFWQWNEDFMYWKFLSGFATVQILLTFSISKILNWDELAQWLGSIIGSLGLFVEALLPLPQIAILYTLKSVQGFKQILLVSWLCGDTVKIAYLVFGAKNISVLFFFFAFFQMALDFYIAGQYIYYKYYYPKHFRNGSPELTEDIEMQPIHTTHSLQGNDTSLQNENKETTPNQQANDTSTSRRASTL